MAQEAPLNFLLKHMESERPCFRVDRDSQKTKTPRRNKEVDEAAKHYKVLGSFMHHVVRPLNHLESDSFRLMATEDICRPCRRRVPVPSPLASLQRQSWCRHFPSSLLGSHRIRCPAAPTS